MKPWLLVLVASAWLLSCGDDQPAVDAPVIGTIDAPGGDSGLGIDSLACVDNGFEPNETESTPQDLGLITDNDGDAAIVSGVINGAGDIDWIEYDGADDVGSLTDPSLSWGASGIRVCVYVQCVVGTTSFTCPGGTSSDTSPNGRAGCCATSGFTIDDLDCSGTTDESSTVSMRVDQPTGAACVTYALTYHF